MDNLSPNTTSIGAAPLAVITGANGFVGSHLAAHLVACGWRVRCVVRKSSNLNALKGLPIELFDGGLGNVALLKPVFADADYIFHIAGVVKAKDLAGYRLGNVEPTRVVLEAAKSATQLKRIVITSSLAAAGSSALGHSRREDEPVSPLTDYGKSKAEQELLAAEYQPTLPITIIRPPIVFGERDTEFFLFFKTIRAGVFPLIRGGKQELSLVYIHDLVRGLLQAALSPRALGQTYFLAYSERFSWQFLIQLTAKHLKKRVFMLPVAPVIIRWIAAVTEVIAITRSKVPTLNRQKGREMLEWAWTCSPDKAQRDFGFAPERDIATDFEHTLNWYQSEGWL